MRISDWSSYVCSSDLASPVQPTPGGTTSRCPAKPKCFGPLPARTASRFSTGPSGRSEERRVGQESVRKCRSRWTPCHYKKKETKRTRTTRKSRQHITEELYDDMTKD